LELRAIADVFGQRNELTQAQSLAEQAAKLADAKAKPDLELYLGQIYLRRGRPADGKRPDAAQLAMLEKARVQFASVLANPQRRQDMVAGNNLAWLLVEHFERPADAIKVIDQVRGERPWEQMPGAFVDTAASAYRKAGQKEMAISVLKSGLLKNSQQASLLYQLGLLLAEQQPDQARKMLNDAVKIGLPPSDEAEAKRLLASL
jgi:tetratricopeptide (TPR) repeat protein